MSGWHGPQYRGAMRDHKADKKRQAVDRNSKTPPERRSKKRQAKS